MRGVKEYVKWFMEENDLTEIDQLFCLSRNCRHGRLYVSVHHIYSKARYPNHPELHNHRNLMMLCQPCHTAFERFERVEEHNELVTERGLDKLFNNPHNH